MNKQERQEAARKRPLMRQPSVAELRAIAQRERETTRRDARSRALQRQDDLIAQAERRRRHQNGGQR